MTVDYETIVCSMNLHYKRVARDRGKIHVDRA